MLIRKLDITYRFKQLQSDYLFSIHLIFLDLSMSLKTAQELFHKHLQLECNICNRNYDMKDRKPYILCRNSHFSCLKCLNLLFHDKVQQLVKCPFCKINIKKQAAIQFRQFENHLLLKQSVFDSIEKCQDLKNILLKTANKSFEKYQFNETIEICKKIIEMNVGYQQNFRAYGNQQEYKGYGIDQQLHFYQSKINHQINVFDLIVLASRMAVEEQQLLQWMFNMQQKLPGNPYILYEIGILSHNLHLYQQSIRYYQQAYKLDEQLPNIQRWMAFSYMRNGEYQLANKLACKLMQKHEQPYQLHICAVQNSQDEYFSYSSKLYQDELMVTNLYPDYIPPFMKLGQEFQNICFYQQALKYYEQCIRKSPSYKDAKLGAARCYLRLQNPGKVIQLFDENNHQKEQIQYLLIKGEAYFKLKKNQKALEMLEKAKKIDSKKEMIYLIESQVYKQENKIEDAIKSLENGLYEDPLSQKILKNLVSIFLENDKKQKIIQLVNNSNFYEILNNQIIIIFGDYFYSKQEYKQSIEIFSKITQIKYKSVIVYQKIIEACCKIGYYKLAYDYSIQYNKNHNRSIESWRKITKLKKLIEEEEQKQKGKPIKQQHLK